MADGNVVETRQAAAYGEFALTLSWDLNELSFRAHAALEVLHNSDDIDCDVAPGLALSYLLRGIQKRAEELALRASNSEYDFEAKPKRGSQPGLAK